MNEFFERNQTTIELTLIILENRAAAELALANIIPYKTTAGLKSLLEEMGTRENLSKNTDQGLENSRKEFLATIMRKVFGDNISDKCWKYFLEGREMEIDAHQLSQELGMEEEVMEDKDIMEKLKRYKKLKKYISINLPQTGTQIRDSRTGVMPVVGVKIRIREAEMNLSA